MSKQVQANKLISKKASVLDSMFIIEEVFDGVVIEDTRTLVAIMDLRCMHSDLAGEYATLDSQLISLYK